MTEPTWAGRTATPPAPGGGEERAGWVPVIGVIAALGLVGAGGYVLGSGGSAVDAAPSTTTADAASDSSTADDDNTATSSSITAGETTATTVETEGGDADPTETGGEGTDSADTGSADTDSAETDSADADPADTDSADTDGNDAVADDHSDAGDEASTDEGASRDETSDGDTRVVIEEGETRGAVLSQGVLYLGGAVPSREVADTIIERAAAIVGEENIVDEYVIDPDAPLAAGAPLYVEDVVLFAYGESTYDPQFEPLLDLGLALLHQNPDVTVTIITHTDSSGSTAYNDLLSYRRGQSVAQYWVDRGVAVERIVIDARGERDPRADNSSAEGAQLNRRAEFYIDGLLG